MMRRWALFAWLIWAPATARAHVGSPNVFFEGDAGPYHLFVAIRCPAVIPGVADIEIRSRDELKALRVVPLRLAGPGSEYPPTPDLADRSREDPHFFTANLWLMERGSLQVRIEADGPLGTGRLAIPIAAAAQRTLSMDRGLGALLIGLMMLLAVGAVSIAAAAAREATLEPGVPIESVPRRRALTAAVVATLVVAGALAFGKTWWDSEDAASSARISRPWQLNLRLEGYNCLVIPYGPKPLLPDHGHLMHLFLIRTPGLDRVFHLHPERRETGEFEQLLPPLPAGRYQAFSDIVTPSGFPLTGVGSIELPDLRGLALSGDDSDGFGPPMQRGTDSTSWALPGRARMIWDRPGADKGVLRAGVPMRFVFRVENEDGTSASLEPYMGMAGHAVFVRSDLSVFAHVHPSGSVSMPALELAEAGLLKSNALKRHAGHHPDTALPPEVAFPYGFPRPGDYRIFVQVKRSGRVETGVFDAHVE